MKSTKRASNAKSCCLSDSSSPSNGGTPDVSTVQRQRIDWDVRFPTIIRVVFAFFLFLFWRVRYGDFLYLAQEYDLFLWDYSYLADASARIAGLARYLSSFFIQFFYFPTLGALILVAFSLFIQYATEKLFRLNGWIGVFSYLPVCLLTIQITNTRYLFFENRDVAYLFSFIFNLAFALAFAMLFNSLRSTKSRVAFFLVGVFVTYPIWGFYTLLGAAICLTLELTAPVERTDAATDNKKSPGKSPKERQRERCELLFLFVLAAPACFYLIKYADTTPSLQYAYISGVPEESVVSAEAEVYTNALYWIYIRDFYLVLCAFFYAVVELRLLVSRKPGADAMRLLKRRTVSRIAFGVVLASFCVGTILCSYATKEYRMLMKMGRALDRQDWDEMIAFEARIPAPNDAAISTRYLALARSGRMADELFERPIMPANDPELKSVPAFFIFGDRILYEYGLINLAERTASNSIVPKRDRSFWSDKTLALCAIANDQRALALRILFTLKKTLFQRRWALELIDYVLWKDGATSPYDRFVSSNGTSEERLLEIDEQFQKIRKQTPFDDAYSPTYGIENMRFSLLDDEDIARREFDDFETRLVSFLVMREYSRFAPFFDQYLALKGKERLPRYFQEAALLREKYPTLFGDESWTMPDGISIDSEIRSRFDEFIRLFVATKKDAKAKEKIQREFSDTFWRSTML